MNHIVNSLLLILLGTAATAHEATHMHHHLTDPNWMPLAAGLVVIAFSALIAWSCK